MQVKSQRSIIEIDCSVPQGSVLGPVKFAAYTEDIVDVVDRHQTRLHLYADDIQLYNSCRLDDVSRVRSQMSSCVADVSQGCESRRLQLNADKTEVIWFGSTANLNKLHSQEHHIQISSEIIIPTSVVRDLGVQLDSELTMKQHIRKVAATSYFSISVVCDRFVVVWTRTDATPGPGLRHHTTGLLYNSLLAGLPLSSLEPLQRVQNAAARLVFQLNSREHITPSFLQLHWLPVRWRVQFKLCVIMHCVHNGRAPAYLDNAVHGATCES